MFRDLESSGFQTALKVTDSALCSWGGLTAHVLPFSAAPKGAGEMDGPGRLLAKGWGAV